MFDNDSQYLRVEDNSRYDRASEDKNRATRKFTQKVGKSKNKANINAKNAKNAKQAGNVVKKYKYAKKLADIIEDDE